VKDRKQHSEFLLYGCDGKVEPENSVSVGFYWSSAYFTCRPGTDAEFIRSILRPPGCVPSVHCRGCLDSIDPSRRV